MPSITIDGTACEFESGETILQVANRNGIDIPQYCYHDGLSIVASCRICLAEVHAPNPRNDNAIEPIPKLLPTCQTPAGDGQLVYTSSPKAIANQKAVMEYLLINHPLDCPVCDQAGECFLQDYSYEYGRGVSRFEETKVKQPKKDLGPHVYLYADRCIMCTRCVRFTREVTGTAELTVEGRGNQEQIDIFPGEALDNELSANVIDLCPVGALLDKDFLFTQRVWFLKSTPSIDGITAGGDNIVIEHNGGEIYRIKPRTNMAVNKWWISDEIRYGYKFVHSEDRLTEPMAERFGKRVPVAFERAYEQAIAGLSGQSLIGIISPMLPSEEAFALAQLIKRLDANAALALGPIPRQGEDKTFPGGYTVYAEKCPNARGVRAVLEAVTEEHRRRGFAGEVLTYEQAFGELPSRGGAIITGNYPSNWVTAEFRDALTGTFVVLLDTLKNPLTEVAEVVLPGATWAEKAGTFHNAADQLQAFEAAIPVTKGARPEGQIASDLVAMLDGVAFEDRAATARAEVIDAMPGQVPRGTTVLEAPGGRAFNAAAVRREMAEASPGLRGYVESVAMPATEVKQEADMQVVEL
ncbi:MAG: 2Fe-2S iron-sulfur cluster-binding protein [Planctomycetota bacterium]